MSKVFQLLGLMSNKFSIRILNSLFGILVVNGDSDNYGTITSKEIMLLSMSLIALMLIESKKQSKYWTLLYNLKIWLEFQSLFLRINKISLSFLPNKQPISWKCIKSKELATGIFKDVVLFKEKESTKVWTGFLRLLTNQSEPAIYKINNTLFDYFLLFL